MAVAHAAQHGGLWRVSGVGFAGANLILARVFPTEQYALFTLFIALVNLGYSLGPAGIDGIVNRRHLEAGPSLLARARAARRRRSGWRWPYSVWRRTGCRSCWG